MSDKHEEKSSDLALAIDIGATKMAVGLVTRRGEMVDREIIGTDRDKNANDLFGGLAILVKRHIERAGERHGGKVVVIGIGSAGPIEPDCVSVSPLNIPSWRRFPLQEAIREVVVDVPIFGDLDAKAFALAEGWLGSAKGHSNFIGMVVSTGVGGGIVLDGKLLDGASGNAGHIGHIIVRPDGNRCGCGARGCLEAEASGSAIEQITGRPATEPSYEIMQRTGRMVGLAVASQLTRFIVPALRVAIPHRAQNDHQNTIWWRWSRVVQHKPWISFVASSLFLIILTVPMLSIRLGFGDAGNSPCTANKGNNKNEQI